MLNDFLIFGFLVYDSLSGARCLERFIYSVFTKETLDEKGQG